MRDEVKKTSVIGSRAVVSRKTGRRRKVWVKLQKMLWGPKAGRGRRLAPGAP